MPDRSVGSPLISVIIPTHNRPRQLEECLRSIASSDYPREQFEVIVVDDGSQCPPYSAVASFRDQLDLTLVVQPHGGPGMARNRGASFARGQLLMFTDDDCTLAIDCLRALARRFAAAPDHAIGGQTVNALPSNPYSTASQTLVSYLYDYYNVDAGRARFFAGNNLAVPAEEFHAIGGFDVDLRRAAGEDREFCDRWIGRGNPMVYAPEAVIFHAHPLGLRSFWRQHFQYGRGAVDFRRARAKDGRGPVHFEPISFYLNLLRYPLRHCRGWRSPMVSALVVITQLANAAGYYWERAMVGAQSGLTEPEGRPPAIRCTQPAPAPVCSINRHLTASAGMYAEVMHPAWVPESRLSPLELSGGETCGVGSPILDVPARSSPWRPYPPSRQGEDRRIQPSIAVRRPVAQLSEPLVELPHRSPFDLADESGAHLSHQDRAS